MKRRFPAAAIAAAVALWLVPSPATSDRLPTRPAESMGDVRESDPWVPDGRDPARIIRIRYQDDTVDSRLTEPTALATNTSETTFQERWTLRIIRALRALAIGGLLR